jgi:hypothetical protein
MARSSLGALVKSQLRATAIMGATRVEIYAIGDEDNYAIVNGEPLRTVAGRVRIFGNEDMADLYAAARERGQS